MFGLRANHKARHILNKYQRGAVPAAGVNEISDFLGRFGVDNPTKFRGAAHRIAEHTACVGNDAYLNSADAGVAGNDLFRVISLEFIQVAIIEDTFKQLPRVVRLAMIFGKNFINLFLSTFGL